MLEYITLKNFKCFDTLMIRVSPLTLITGMNGVGKSTLIQSLLVIRQSYVSRYLQDGYLSLNGELVNLINGASVLYKKAVDDSFEIGIEDSNEKLSFSVDLIDGDNHLQKIQCIAKDNLSKKINLLNDDFVYLNAERLSPQKSYKLQNQSEKNFSRLGNMHGDKAVGILFESIDKVLELNISELKSPHTSNTRVGDNVSAWMGAIMGLKLTAKVEKVSSDELNLSYTIGESIEENVFSPLNTAFGYSYILPIIVAVLTAQRNGIILLENPEAHLHPAAQFRLGYFLALAAQHGIQIVIETHSDHLMNGIRVATKENIIDSENVTIQYFDYKDTIHSAQRIELDENGGLDRWPKGFFDEWEKALDILIE